MGGLVMKNLHILFGFKEENEVINKIVNSVRASGVVVSYVERTTKDSIREYLQNNENCSCAVLRECMGAESFSAEELAELTDVRDINIVPIIEKEHKGTKFMDTIYAAGITSAIITGPGKGATPGQIAELLLHKRNRKQARSYYGIKTKTMKLDILTYGDYLTKYSILMNEQLGVNMIERYLSIAKTTTPKQMAEFTQKLPVNVRRNLQTYEEFWIVINSLKKYGINITATKPSVLKRGLTQEQYRKAIERDAKSKRGQAGPKVKKLQIDEQNRKPIELEQKEKQQGGENLDSVTSLEQKIEFPDIEELVMAAEQEESIGLDKESGKEQIPLNSDSIEENYFVQQMMEEQPLSEMMVSNKERIKAPKNPVACEIPTEKKKVASLSQGNSSKQGKTNISSKKGRIEIADEGMASKAFQKKKKKYGVNWKVVICTFIVGIILLGIWYYLISYLGLF